MAKNFTNKLTSKRSAAKKKLTDAEIEAAFESGGVPAAPAAKPTTTEDDSERLYLRVPKHLHDRLKASAKRLGITKSAIVKQGITAELDRLEGK